MNTIRQERKSCETCRSRKLRCSGEKSGCSRCRGLSMPCNFKDKGLPGRPRKRVRVEEQELNRERTGSSHSSNFPSILPHSPFSSQEAMNMLVRASGLDSIPPELSGTCGFDSFDWDMLANTDVCSPSEPWKTYQNAVQQSEPPAFDPYISPMSLSQSCKCDEEVSDTVRKLSRAHMSNDIIQVLRIGISLTERLLICPICYDTSKPPRLTVQNVLLIGQLMFEITSSYQKYLHWLDEHCTELDLKNESELIYLDSGLGIPEISLQLSGEKFRDLVMSGLRKDTERMSALGKRFAQRQRNRHMAGHEVCPDLEGRCRKKEYLGVDHDPLDLCPQDPMAKRLVPCFRIVDEVREMIERVVDAVV